MHQIYTWLFVWTPGIIGLILPALAAASPPRPLLLEEQKVLSETFISQWYRPPAPRIVARREPSAGPSVAVGLIDTEVDFSHPFLRQNLPDTAPTPITEDLQSSHSGLSPSGERARTTPTHCSPQSATTRARGWNFVSQSEVLFHEKNFEGFSCECQTYLLHQERIVSGQPTAISMQIVQDLSRSVMASKELQRYMRVIHGTHLAGILLHENQTSPSVSVVAAPLIRPDADRAVTLIQGIGRARDRQSPPEPQSAEGSSLSPLEEVFRRTPLNQRQQLEQILLSIARERLAFLDTAIAYLRNQGVQIVLATPEVRLGDARNLVSTLNTTLHSELNPEEIHSTAEHFLMTLKSLGLSVLARYPQVLFIVSAGNDLRSMRSCLSFPLSLWAPNSVIVTATRQNRRLATFAATHPDRTDLAAPGVGITSSSPGDSQISLSGTAQAAAVVARTAAKALGLNPKLSPSELKQLLIETGDDKDFLRAQTRTGKLLNEARAQLAAAQSVEIGLETASAVAQKLPLDYPLRSHSQTASSTTFLMRSPRWSSGHEPPNTLERTWDGYPPHLSFLDYKFLVPISPPS